MSKAVEVVKAKAAKKAKEALLPKAPKPAKKAAPTKGSGRVKEKKKKISRREMKALKLKAKKNDPEKVVIITGVICGVIIAIVDKINEIKSSKNRNN